MVKSSVCACGGKFNGAGVCANKYQTSKDGRTMCEWYCDTQLAEANQRSNHQVGNWGVSDGRIHVHGVKYTA